MRISAAIKQAALHAAAKHAETTKKAKKKQTSPWAYMMNVLNRCGGISHSEYQRNLNRYLHEQYAVIFMLVSDMAKGRT